MNSSVLACSYAVSGAGALKLSSRASSVPCVAPSSSSGVCEKVPLIRAQNQDLKEEKANVGGRRAALLGLAAALVASSVSTSSANAGVIEEYLERSKANKVCFHLGFFLFFIYFDYPTHFIYFY